MNASIGEPFLLASYGHSAQGSSSSKTSRPGVFATQAELSSSDGFVTVAAQQDGIHILDVSTLHPIASHTLGPRTTFSCPPASRISFGQNGAKTCTTYAAIASEPGISKEDGSRSVRMWTDSLTGESSEQPQTAVTPHHVAAMFAPAEISPRVVLISPKAGIAVTSTKLAGEHLVDSPSEEAQLVKALSLARRSCTFIPVHVSATDGSVLLLFFGMNQKLHIKMVVVNQDGSIMDFGKSIIPKIQDSDVSQVSCSPSGYVSVLTRSGTWSSFQISTHDYSFTVISIAEHILLANLLFAPDNTALLSLTSSHILLAGLTKEQKPDIVLLLWDVQYSVLLAEHTIQLPSSLPTTPGGVSVELTTSISSQAALILSPLKSNQRSTSTHRSTILMVPFTVPATSTIANVMGRASSGSKWLIQNTSPSSSDTSDLNIAESLAKIRAAVDKGKENKANAFKNDWSSIQTALDTILDIPEADIISLLQIVVTHHRQLSSNPNAMRVDSEHVPALPSFLSKCVILSTTPATLRLAIRQRLNDAEDLVCVLKVLDDWMDVWSSKEVKLLPANIPKQGTSIYVPVSDEKGNVLDPPPLTKILSFLQTLLDSSFLTLLQHPPSHALLHGIFSKIEPEIAYINEIERLRAPLEPFVRAQSKKLKEFLFGPEKKEEIDWRKRKDGIREQTHVAVGQYRLEKLVL